MIGRVSSGRRPGTDAEHPVVRQYRTEDSFRNPWPFMREVPRPRRRRLGERLLDAWQSFAVSYAIMLAGCAGLAAEVYRSAASAGDLNGDRLPYLSLVLICWAWLRETPR